MGIDEDEDALSLSPGEGSSPNPAKRQCLQQDSGDALHQRTQTSTSSSHSDLRQELEAATKDNPADIVEVSCTLTCDIAGHSEIYDRSMIFYDRSMIGNRLTGVKIYNCSRLLNISLSMDFAAYLVVPTGHFVQIHATV